MHDVLLGEIEVQARSQKLHRDRLVRTEEPGGGGVCRDTRALEYLGARRTPDGELRIRGGTTARWLRRRDCWWRGTKIASRARDQKRVHGDQAHEQASTTHTTLST